VKGAANVLLLRSSYQSITPETTMHCCSLELEQFFHQIFACEALKYDSVLGFCFFLLFVLSRQMPLLHYLLLVHLRETNLGLGFRVMLSI
jgi:hypothetical protein